MAVKRIPATRFTPIIVFSGSLWHWNGKPGGGCAGNHGRAATYWPWWKFVAFLWCNITCNPEAPGRRFWVYTRRGALHFDCWIDRRDVMRGILP